MHLKNVWPIQQNESTLKWILVVFILLVDLLFVSTKNVNASIKSESIITGPRGFLVSTEELNEIRNKAITKIEPFYTNVGDFLFFIDSLIKESENWPSLTGEIVVKRSASHPIQLSASGGKLVYGTAIAWHITRDAKYAKLSRQLILDLTDTYGYRDFNRDKFHYGSQGILNLARGGTPYIFAADLLEGWEGWSEDDKLTYQIWLRDVQYPKVAWASRYRKNNWGVAGSFSAAAIAFYLMDHPDWLLKEFNPFEINLSPQDAFNAHNTLQIKRQNTSEEWKMDAKTFLWGIQSNGAIPEEIRRGNDPVDGDYLPSEGSGTHYTMTYIEHLTAHAEFLHQRGDNSLYENCEPDGSGSLLQAYLFVIDNPLGSHCFTIDRRNALYIAYSYYKHPALLRSIKACGKSNIAGQRLALYGRLTHSFFYFN
jgi:hypothetical protein